MTTTDRDSVILVVEDNEDNRVIYGTMLRVHGFVVHEAADAEEALLAIASTPPSLILMDIGLPGMDGVEATRQLKSNPGTASIPVLALTAHALLAERERAMNAGVEGYLIKPISSAILVREVQLALRDAANRAL